MIDKERKFLPNPHKVKYFLINFDFFFFFFFWKLNGYLLNIPFIICCAYLNPIFSFP